MHDQPVEAEHLGAIQFLVERLDRFPPQRDVGGCDVDQVAVVRDDGTDLRLAHAAAEERDLLRRDLARAPLARRLRENLQRLAAARFGAIDGARQPAGDREMGTK